MYVFKYITITYYTLKIVYEEMKQTNLLIFICDIYVIYILYFIYISHILYVIYFLLLTAHDVEYFTLLNIPGNYPPNLLKYIFLRGDN